MNYSDIISIFLGDQLDDMDLEEKLFLNRKGHTYHKHLRFDLFRRRFPGCKISRNAVVI